MRDFKPIGHLLVMEVVGVAAIFTLGLVDMKYFGVVVVVVIIGLFALAIGLRGRD
jgi:hypothetical protein